jgi:hypothetical protein
VDHARSIVLEAGGFAGVGPLGLTWRLAPRLGHRGDNLEAAS